MPAAIVVVPLRAPVFDDVHELDTFEVVNAPPLRW